MKSAFAMFPMKRMFVAVSTCIAIKMNPITPKFLLMSQCFARAGLNLNIMLERSAKEMKVIPVKADALKTEIPRSLFPKKDCW